MKLERMTVAEFDFYCLVVYGRLNPSSPAIPRPPFDEVLRLARAKHPERPFALLVCNGDRP